jgi:hypothetical protein
MTHSVSANAGNLPPISPARFQQTFSFNKYAGLLGGLADVSRAVLNSFSRASMKNGPSAMRSDR